MILHPKFWLWVSTFTMVACILVIIIIRPLLGIDFTGGSLIEIRASSDDIHRTRNLLSNSFSLSSTVQSTQEDSLLIRTTPITTQTVEDIVAALTKEGVTQEAVLRFESIGPTIGDELKQKAWQATSIVIGIMLVYLAYTFRSAGGLVAPWKFGAATVIALIHDLLFVTALFAILGKVWGVTLDTLFVTAQLAILGYSVNDTIIIFNRVKSDWIRTRSRDLLAIINGAVRATLIRSFNTSFTTLLVLVALLVFGGSTIRWFVVALTAGTIVGTYSSIFVATPLLWWLAKKQ